MKPDKVPAISGTDAALFVIRQVFLRNRIFEAFVLPVDRDVPYFPLTLAALFLLHAEPVFCGQTLPKCKVAAIDRVVSDSQNRATR
jgi:hypothetical protein